MKFEVISRIVALHLSHDSLHLHITTSSPAATERSGIAVRWSALLVVQ
jgi:predicted DNA-binding protein with PD1-like motif